MDFLATAVFNQRNSYILKGIEASDIVMLKIRRTN